MKSGHYRSPFFTVSRMWFLLVRLACMAMGLYQSFPPKRGGKSRPRTGVHFNVPKGPVPESNGASLAKRSHTESTVRAHAGGRKSAGGSVSASSADAKKKGNCGVGTLDVSQTTVLIFSFAGLYTFPFFINGDALLPTGLCFIWFRLTIFSLGHIFPCSIISGSSMLRKLWLIIPFFKM